MRSIFLIAVIVISSIGGAVADNGQCIPGRQTKTAEQIRDELARNKRARIDNWQLFQLTEVDERATLWQAAMFRDEALLYYDSGDLAKALDYLDIALRLKTKFTQRSAPLRYEWGPRGPGCPPWRKNDPSCSGWEENSIRANADVDVAEMFALISIVQGRLGNDTEAVATSRFADLVFENWVIKNAMEPRRVSEVLEAQSWIDGLRLETLSKIANKRSPVSRHAFEQGLAVVQRAQFGKVDWSLRQAAARRAVTDPRTMDLIQQRQSLQAARSGAYRNTGLHEELATQIRKLESELTPVASAIESELFFQAAAIEELQAQLLADEAILAIVMTELGGHSLWITKTDFGWETSQQGCDWTRRRVANLLNPINEPNKAAFDRNAAFEVYTSLWSRAMRGIGRRVIFLSVTGELARVPAGLLVAERPQGSDSDEQALRRTKWLLASHTIVNIPSIRSMITRKSNAGPRNQRIVVVGDPILPNDVRAEYRSGGLGRLPYTDEEIGSVLRGVPPSQVTRLTGDSATVARVRSTNLRGLRLLLFATHAVSASGSAQGREPALVLTADDRSNGWLKGSDVAALPIDADVVVLSGCDTASPDRLDGVAFSGLAASFLFAGGRTVVVTHWPVFDKAAAQIIGNSFAVGGPRASREIAAAIRREALKMMNTSSTPRAAEPISWAPYTVIGR